MVKQEHFESSKLAALNSTAAQSDPPLPVGAVERRNWAERYALLCRVYREFEEMPGLSVTPDQAAKLFGLPPDVALRILWRLVGIHMLRQKRDGQFASRVEDS